MASYVEFRDSINQKKGDEVMSSYTALMTDIKYCINLLEELEYGRGYKDWVSDWAVGKRSSLNIDRTRKNLGKLHSEIRKGLTVHTSLFSLITKARMIQQSLRLRIETMENSGRDTSLLLESYNKISNTNEEFYSAVDNLENTGIFVKKETKMNKTAAAVGEVGDGIGIGIAGTVSLALASALVISTGGTALMVGGGIAAVTGTIFLVAHSYGKKKGIKYQELKFLSESLHDLRLLSELESHHIALDEIIKGFKENIEFYKKEVESIQTFVIATQTRAQTQAPTKNPPTLDDAIKATRMYDKVFRENLQSLQESEPDMNAEMRKRMATKLAETACKTFLKEKLNYSETEINEFLRKIST